MRCNNDCLMCTPFLHIFQHFIVHTSFLPSTCPLFPLSSAERDSENIVVTDVIYTLSRQSLSLSLSLFPALAPLSHFGGRPPSPAEPLALPPSLSPTSLPPSYLLRRPPRVPTPNFALTYLSQPEPLLRPRVRPSVRPRSAVESQSVWRLERGGGRGGSGIEPFT